MVYYVMVTCLLKLLYNMMAEVKVLDTALLCQESLIILTYNAQMSTFILLM